MIALHLLPSLLALIALTQAPTLFSCGLTPKPAAGLVVGRAVRKSVLPFPLRIQTSAFVAQIAGYQLVMPREAGVVRLVAVLLAVRLVAVLLAVLTELRLITERISFYCFEKDAPMLSWGVFDIS